MKVVLQRVSSASVSVDGTITGRIDKGYVILLGVGAKDTKDDVHKLVDKIMKLRIFSDEDGKTNLSIEDVGGGLLVVSQFTLYADCRKGNRPSFTDAGPPDLAEALYNYFVEYAQSKAHRVAQGVFGAMMSVELVNDGPFTIVLDS